MGVEIGGTGLHGFEGIQGAVQSLRLLFVEYVTRCVHGGEQPLPRRHLANKQQADAFVPASTFAQGAQTVGFNDPHGDADAHRSNGGAQYIRVVL